MALVVTLDPEVALLGAPARLGGAAHCDRRILAHKMAIFQPLFWTYFLANYCHYMVEHTGRSVGVFLNDT